MGVRSHVRLLVSGMIARDPFQGGATWAVLQYLVGLRRLGHDVYFVEPVPADALQPQGAPLEKTRNTEYFLSVMREFGFEHHAALLVTGTEITAGLPYARLAAIAGECDVLINISGMLTDRRLIDPIPARVYLDLDPAFNQLWQASAGIDMRFDGHSHFVTVGRALGDPDCPVPLCGRSWIPTWQPIVLEHWPVARRIDYDGLTTVGNWRGYGSIEHDGVFYGQKAHALREFMTLPRLTAERFMPAFAIHPGETRDLEALRANGWELLDPAAVASTPAEYRRFVGGSKAEFGIAKSGYVKARCGWFSDRSVCYLASGRPVIAQDTGFSRYLPTGEGLFAFSTTDEVVDAIGRLRTDYERHARAARALAEEHFDSDVVLSRLLDRVGLGVAA
jgi:hypothetical protein